MMQAYIIFCLISVFGGLFTYPVVTIVFFGDRRFWRYLHLAPSLYFFLVRGAYKIARGGTPGFLFSVSLTEPPVTAPDLAQVRLKTDWPHGDSCGHCTRCCDKIKCPIVDRRQKLCRGYNSICWRYFNCGRFPTSQQHLDYYQCPKWELR
jgi:hypothetical protein